MSFSRQFTKCEHEKYRHFAAISRVFVVFYNVNTVRSEMLVWDFPNHSSSTRDLENPILTFPISQYSHCRKLQKLVNLQQNDGIFHVHTL